MARGDASSLQPAQADDARPQVLIVEDEPAIAVLFETLLHMEGFEPTVATSTKAALKVLEKAVPDVVVLDVMIPDESGLKVCRHIRKRPHLREIPVIIVSARTQDSDIAAGYQAGADAYLAKPIPNHELVEIVRQLVDRGREGETCLEKPKPAQLEIESAVPENKG